MHPCQFSPEVIEVLRGLIRPGEHIHDPFAGTGLRLGALCDEIGARFTGCDIEEWPDMDRRRVIVDDSTFPHAYPAAPFTIATSPVYQNKRLADYANGPLPTTKTKGRRDYGIALGRALHPNNLARTTGRRGKAKEYWRLHGECVKRWGDRVLLNCDFPLLPGWNQLLTDAGYEVVEIYPAKTKRYRGLDNAEKRAPCEVVIEAVKD